LFFPVKSYAVKLVIVIHSAISIYFSYLMQTLEIFGQTFA
jgi:hypothetical protein